jgi:hypothetical protein
VVYSGLLPKGSQRCDRLGISHSFCSFWIWFLQGLCQRELIIRDDLSKEFLDGISSNDLAGLTEILPLEIHRNLSFRLDFF